MFHTGVRRFAAEPVFSQHSASDKHKARGPTVTGILLLGCFFLFSLSVFCQLMAIMWLVSMLLLAILPILYWSSSIRKCKVSTFGWDALLLVAMVFLCYGAACNSNRWG